MKGKAINGQSYKDAGVDIDAANALIEAIKPLAKATGRAGVLGSLGGFGGLFDLRAAGFTDPVLVAATDGVGTKLKLAFASGRHETIGIDLVAMCVNDLVVQGAEPLFFLDYFATGALDGETAKKVMTGIAEGCKQAGCALIGGETAEMPGLYNSGEYDLAGFAVGAVERGRVLSGKDTRTGDVILGLASSGVHSNGFSLVRRVMEKAGLDFNDAAPFGGRLTIGEALLTPTRIYVNSCLAAIKTGGVGGLAHITGGGLKENLPRVLAAGLGAEIDCRRWAMPAVFGWLREAGGIEWDEMARTFNLGIGMTVIVRPDRADAVAAALEEAGETVAVIGEVTEGSETVLSGLDG